MRTLRHAFLNAKGLHFMTLWEVTMNAYLYAAGRRMAAGLKGRFEILSGIAARYVEVLAIVFLWKWVYRKRESLYGMSEAQMSTWVILAAGLTVFYSMQVHLKIRDEIKRGGPGFLYPCSLPGIYLAEDLGRAVTGLPMRCIPVVLLGGLTFGLIPPVGERELMLAACFVAAGWLMIWILYAIVGTASCWLMELGELGVALAVLIAFLSGSMLPLEFFPQPVREALFRLPFHYAFQTPLSLYLGRITPEEGLWQLGAMLAWILLLLCVLKLVWESARKKLQGNRGFGR